MALTEFQRRICRHIASHRIESGESYVDTQEALAATWDSDRTLLVERGYAIEVLRERPTFIEAVVRDGREGVVMQWVCDSAYRFFPLVQHDDFGLTLHPFDLATNKVLALVGRLEVRDWIDVMNSSDRIQHLGLLAWAACGKDPGFNPSQILTEAARSSHYAQAEVSSLDFDGAAPDAAALSARWSALLREAHEMVGGLPAAEVGRCVLGSDHRLFQGGPERVREACLAGELRFHEGSIRGALPVPCAEP